MNRKIIKIKEFREDYSGSGRYQGKNDYKDLVQWQKDNPNIKIIDTKIQQMVFTNYENYLLVSYEEEAED